MKQIPLTQGYSALVDDEDYDMLMDFKWHLHKDRARPGLLYAATNIVKECGQRTTTQMHRLLLPDKDGYMRDHKNGNGLDNRRENLRYLTRAQNMHNSQRRQPRTISCYRGVYQRRLKWVASMTVDGYPQYLGIYSTQEEAALAYNKAALERWGENARLNVVVLVG